MLVAQRTKWGEKIQDTNFVRIKVIRWDQTSKEPSISMWTMEAVCHYLTDLLKNGENTNN